jgi:hypothetical protein
MATSLPFNVPMSKVFLRRESARGARGMLETLGVTNDGSTDATAAQLHLMSTITARQRARVPQWMWDAETRLKRTRR